jgi:menaquinone-dependent protoporphyrinogen oxidase
MSRILVLYGTSEGQTAKVGARHRGEVVPATPSMPKWCAPAPPIRARPTTTASSSPVQSTPAATRSPSRGGCARTPVSLPTSQRRSISVCLSILSKKETARDEATPLPRRFVERLGWQPTMIKVVAGALPYTRYGVLTRWIMKRIASDAGGDTDTSRDYEYTDWRDLRDFADRFATLVSPARAISA